MNQPFSDFLFEKDKRCRNFVDGEGDVGVEGVEGVETLEVAAELPEEQLIVLAVDCDDERL